MSEQQESVDSKFTVKKKIKKKFVSKYPIYCTILLVREILLLLLLLFIGKRAEDTFFGTKTTKPLFFEHAFDNKKQNKNTNIIVLNREIVQCAAGTQCVKTIILYT